MSLRILVLEDRPADFELAIERLSGAGREIVGERVDSASGFADALARFKPDVVLCDHGVPGFSALRALEVVKATTPATPFVIHTGASDLPAVVACLKAGADDVVLKSDAGRLEPAIRNALDLRKGLEVLSPRQIEVLRLVAQGLSTRAIAERLGLSLKTVESHRTEMMRRLDLHDVASVVRYALKVRLITAEG